MISTLPVHTNATTRPDDPPRPSDRVTLRPIVVPAPPPPDPASEVDWFDLVCRIQKNEKEALEELYTLIAKGIKILIVRQLGRQEVDDRVHDTFLLVVQSIQRGDLREPERLIAFARTIVRRRISQYIEKSAISRRESLTGEATSWVPGGDATPEEAAIQAQTEDIMLGVLRSLSRRDREILTRFYLLEQSAEKICLEMELTETQFRLLKSRAKARFGEEGRRRTAKNKIRNFFLRKSTS
jgi:RNA polymerase sigma factor (sigma-70 family)